MSRVASAVSGLIVLACLVPPAALESSSQRTQRRPAAKPRTQAAPESAQAAACSIAELKKSPATGFSVPSKDGTRFVVNREDDKGAAQMYVGTNGSDMVTCITCTQQPGGAPPRRLKAQPHWHPSGRWIFMSVEREQYSPPPVLGWSRAYVEGQLRNGLFTNMYAVSPDGTTWHRMTDFKSGVKGVADGYTGPAFTPDGTQAVWSQIVDGNIFRYHPFGRWELILADFQERNGVPTFSNLRNITPEGMHWNESGSFSADGVSLLISGSTEKDAQGMDQYILNIRTGALTNLTRSPTVWDEHGRFSPDGEKIIFMSAYPYRADPRSSKTLSIKTEFMLMNKDGSGLVQLTHFREPGHPEYPSGIAANPEWSHDGRSANLAALNFPKYDHWEIVFQGPCGRSTGAH